MQDQEILTSIRQGDSPIDCEPPAYLLAAAAEEINYVSGFHSFVLLFDQKGFSLSHTI